jgi:hypothetical protein
MPSLRFPSDKAVGTLEWLGSRHAVPMLASGVVTAPDEAEVSLDVMLIESVRRVVGAHRAVHSSLRVQSSGPDGPAEYLSEDSESWEITGSTQPVDLGFLRNLPADSITDLRLQSPIVAESFPAVAHLAPGLRRLYLAWSDLADDALPTVAALQGLVYLQSWGNHFTDSGVQQLASLSRLESLFLEEETLSAAAFDFTAGLPHLARLGLQDVALSAAELTELRQRLHSADVG